MNKSKALGFADYLKCGGDYPPTLGDIAVELERQHGEIESMRAERLQTERRLANVEAQRDALLEALKFYAFTMGRRKSDNEPFYMSALDLDCGDRARAAIKAVEENPHT